MKIALIAHDRKKDTMVALAREFAAGLSRCTLMATGTTGGGLRDEVGLDVECLLSGPLVGDLQIGARLQAGLPYVHHRCRQRDHTRRAPRTSFSDGDDVTTSRPGGTSNSDPGLRVRLPLLKSP